MDGRFPLPTYSVEALSNKGAIPIKKDCTKDWCFGPAAAAYFMLVNCYEREFFIEDILDEVHGPSVTNRVHRRAL
jgi:hypothetical protein